MLCRWIQSRDKLLHSTTSKHKYRLGNPGRKSLYHSDGTETTLFNWITTERSKGFIISPSDIQQRMLELINDSSLFKALTGFMRRFHLSLRMPTRNALTAPINESNTIHAFHKYISNLYQSHSINDVINVDQTPVWWNSMHSNQRTVDIKGKRKVYAVKSLPHTNPREKVSVILACSRNGHKLPPAIIVKSSSLASKRARIKLVNGVLVFLNPLTSMANSDIMQRWIRIIMPETQSQTQKNLLIMDSFRGHLTDEVKQACIDKRVLRAVIPGGFTSHLQPLDLTVNRSFKSHLRQEYKSALNKSLNNTHTPAERLGVLCDAGRCAWKRINPTVIRNGFHSMYRCMILNR